MKDADSKDVEEFAETFIKNIIGKIGGNKEGIIDSLDEYSICSASARCTSRAWTRKRKMLYSHTGHNKGR